MESGLTRRALLRTSLAGTAGTLLAGSGLGGSGSANAATLDRRSPTPVTHRIDAIIADINPLDFGISVAVYKRHRRLFAKGYGWRDRGLPESFTGTDYFGVEQLDHRLDLSRAQVRPNIDTIYDMGSVSKQFTAGCILLLHQRRRLDVHDPLTAYFPASDRWNGITLLDLLHHESGIPDYNYFPQFSEPYAKFMDSGQSDYSPIVTKLESLPLLFPPGSKYKYSNSNYLLLGLIVAKVSGASYARFLDRHILGRFGMCDTKQGYPRRGSTDVALGYLPDDSTVYRAYQWNLPWLQGAGGLTSTARDIGRWDWAVQHPGLFRRDTLRLMFTPRLGSYACGWVVTTHKEEPYVWHNGSVGGYHTMNALFPDHHVAVVLLSNNEKLQPKLEEAAPRVFDAVSGAG